MAVALHLFQERKDSARKAAELAGFSPSDFMEACRQRRINWVEFTDEELGTEVHR